MANIVWLYGLSGAGKSTIADALGRGYHATVIDSDVLRHAWPELGFDAAAKKERARRLLAVAKQFDRAVVACITPYIESRCAVREAGALLVYVDTPHEICARRRPTLYGIAKDLAGVNAPFDDVVSYRVAGKGTTAWNALQVAKLAGWA